LLLFGCASVQRPPTTIASLDTDAVTARAEYQALLAATVDRLARRAVARGDHTLDLLLLSGGAQNGAYGSGFLVGWRARTSEAMPRFDLVTGVSTGALQAPFALIGSEEALDTIFDLYRDAPERVAPSVDWFYWVRRTGGVVTIEKYRETLHSVVSPRLRDELLAAFREGRQLIFLTTDMDLGVGQLWDMSHELDSSDAGLARVRELLLAATAVPGIFPPVAIDGHVHADGATIANILPLLRFEDYQALATRLAALGETSTVTIRMWVIENFWNVAPPVVTDIADPTQLEKRSSQLVFFAAQPLMLQYLSALARAVSGGVPGVRVEMRYTAIPAALASDPQARKLFEHDWIHRLQRLGYERAQSTSPWDSIPSPYQRP